MKNKWHIGAAKHGASMLSLLLLSVAAHAGELVSTHTAENVQTVALNSPFEKDAQEVLALISVAVSLREQLPSFVEESNQAITTHNGALPSALSLIHI